jgi:hypothetical protein
LKGLERAGKIERKTIRFIIGPEIYECNRGQAAFLSNAIARLICADCTIDRFELGEIDDCHHLFGTLFPLIEVGSMILNDENCVSMERFGKILENEERVDLAVNFENRDQDLSLDNCIFWLRLRASLNLEIENELPVKFVASHFSELDVGELRNLENELIEAILTDPHIRLTDEDTLVVFIQSLDEDYSNLIGYDRTEFLSSGGIIQFLLMISGESLDSRIWESVCRHLRCAITEHHLSESRFVSSKT